MYCWHGPACLLPLTHWRLQSFQMRCSPLNTRISKDATLRLIMREPSSDDLSVIRHERLRPSRTEADQSALAEELLISKFWCSFIRRPGSPIASTVLSTCISSR